MHFVQKENEVLFACFPKLWLHIQRKHERNKLGKKKKTGKKVIKIMLINFWQRQLFKLFMWGMFVWGNHRKLSSYMFSGNKHSVT